MLQWICQVVMVSQFLRPIRHPLCIKSQALPHDLFHRRAKHQPPAQGRIMTWLRLFKSLCFTQNRSQTLFWQGSMWNISSSFPSSKLSPSHIAQLWDIHFMTGTLHCQTIHLTVSHIHSTRGVKGSRSVYVFHSRSMFQQCLFAKFQDVTLLFAQTSLYTTHTFKRFQNQNCSKRYDEIFAIEVASIPTKTWQIKRNKKNNLIVRKRMPVPHCHVKSSVFAREEQVAKPSKATEGFPGLPAAEVRKSKAPKRLEASAARSSACCSLAETKWMQVASNS